MPIDRSHHRPSRDPRTARINGRGSFDQRADLDLIFANPDGTPFKPDSISAAVSLLFRRLKLPKGASLHSLRHSHCSHLLASGVPLPAVSARLGHGSIRTTQEIYSHMIHGQDDEAAKKWEEFQNRPLSALHRRRNNRCSEIMRSPARHIGPPADCGRVQKKVLVLEFESL